MLMLMIEAKTNRGINTFIHHNVNKISSTTECSPPAESSPSSHILGFHLCTATASWLLGSLSTTCSGIWLINFNCLRLQPPTSKNICKLYVKGFALEGDMNLIFWKESRWWKLKIPQQVINTSALESDSASLCLISLAIEKKTSSTFKLVFALCIQIIWIRKLKEREFQHSQVTQQYIVTHSFKELDTILISKCLTLWGRHSLKDK